MKFHDTLKTAGKGVTVNLTRSMLTMLGIIIGVGSVILMSSIGASMQGVILGQVSSLGAKSMVIFPGNQEGAAQGMPGYDSLTFEDLAQIKKLGSVTNVSPVIFIRGKTTYGKEEASPQVFGVPATFFKNQNITAAQGRLIDENDDGGSRQVALLGSETATKLFGDLNPLGKSVKIGNNHFQIVGVAKALGSQFFQSADDRIYVPFSVARNITGQKYLDYMTLEATESFDEAFADLKFLLRYRHNIDNPEDDPKKDDFIIHSSEEANQILGAVSLGLTMFITTIAAISLIVGGIGIMNIMLVSVTERTREIGLRKAIGATRRNILIQFLIEAVLLTGIGGVIGLLLGIFLAFTASIFITPILSTYLFAVSVPSVIASLLMASMTGLVFGISPARKAASLSPMEALRYE